MSVSITFTKSQITNWNLSLKLLFTTLLFILFLVNIYGISTIKYEWNKALPTEFGNQSFLVLDSRMESDIDWFKDLYLLEHAETHENIRLSEICHEMVNERTIRRLQAATYALAIVVCIIIFVIQKDLRNNLNQPDF